MQRDMPPRRWRGLVAAGFAFLIALAILISLGIWQIQRLAWKTKLIAEITERTTAVPQALPPEERWATLNPEDYAYRHVTVTGTFEHDKESHVFRPLAAGSNRGPLSGLGDLILTPLRLANGSVVIVNRGFVPQDRVDATTRQAGQTAGPVTITGLMREAESRNLFTPADDPTRGTWFTRDPAAMASFWHLERAAPFTIDADAGSVPGGLPQGGETVLDLPNNHLSYALTWFGLAIGLCLVFAGVVWKRLNGGSTSLEPLAIASAKRG